MGLQEGGQDAELFGVSGKTTEVEKCEQSDDLTGGEALDSHFARSRFFNGEVVIESGGDMLQTEEHQIVVYFMNVIRLMPDKGGGRRRNRTIRIGDGVL